MFLKEKDLISSAIVFTLKKVSYPHQDASVK